MKDIFEMTKSELADYITDEEFNEFLFHVRARHINRCDAFLKERIMGAARKNAASTFKGTDREICLFLRVILYKNMNMLYEWLHSELQTMTITDVLPPGIEAVKYLYRSGAVHKADCHSAVIVLNKNEARGIKRIKITAFPK